MECRDRILSNDYYDIIRDYPVEPQQGMGYDYCYVNIESLYNIIYVNRSGIPNMNEYFFDYQTIPKLYGLMQTAKVAEGFDPGSLIASGITQLQRSPLQLRGQGVVLCVIDTGAGVMKM